ncbi:nucleoside triphosphate pyrophosphohydrolase [Terriglobus sp.]|uniref:nucleoside triphosphate pyrophosphohydrolase n=1 Tax=Terriglobus sp. TaxID=1889013 RepID=UPI003AFFDD44
MSHLAPTQVEAQRDAAAAFAEAAAIMARLRAPDGCPWDRAQTLDSIKPHTLEETYEVFDAIDRRDWAGLQDELGDLLLQVLSYAQIAHDEGRFGIADVIRTLSAKLLRRHPHVFGDASADTPDDVITTWERVKQQERAAKPQPQAAGLLAGISSAMPAFTEARKLGKAAANIGFDWPNADGLFDKIAEEVQELRDEVDPAAPPDTARIEEEFGDLLFVMTNLARHLKVDPEQALRRANAKFRRRFSRMEAFAADTPLAEHTTAQMEDLWDRAKQEERA